MSIRSEQIRLIYRQGPVMVLGATLVAVIVAAFLWHQIPKQSLLIWLCLIFFSAALRVAVFHTFTQQGLSEPGRGPWGLLFWTGSLISGCVWGALPLLFHSDSAPEHLLLISTIFAGMVAVTASAGSIYLPSFYSFSLPLVLPLTVMHLRSGLDYLVLTGVMLVFFLLINVLLARRGYRQYLQLIEARFRNADLMEKLSAEKSIAEKAVHAKNQFLAAASHDLRQPLHALGMFIGSLRKREIDKERLDIIGDMESSTNALGQLLHSLLDMSRLDAGAIRVKRSHINLGQLLAALSTEFLPLSQQKNLSLTVDCSEQIVYSDRLLLERIIRNLLTNAIRYTHVGKVSVTVVNRTATDLELRICDTGIGIADVDQVAVFSEYHQVRDIERLLSHGETDASSQREGFGLGLGLSIVDRLCRLLDISLAMQSEPGAGTEFKLTLPVGNSVDVIEASVETIATDLTNRVVMVIDDERQVLRAMSSMLSDWGCHVISATSGKDALFELARVQEKPEVILCDYRLGGRETGIDVIQALREGTNRDIPSVIVTGDTSPTRLREVAKSNLRILHKPVVAHSLRQTLAECLQPP